MADIKLDHRELALWNEVGSRGDAFREATRDRVFEQVRLTRRMIEIVDDGGRMIDSITIHEPVPESGLRRSTLPIAASQLVRRDSR